MIKKIINYLINFSSSLTAALISLALPFLIGCGDDKIANPDSNAKTEYSGKIAFLSQRSGDTGRQIYIMDSNGKNLSKLFKSDTDISSFTFVNGNTLVIGKGESYYVRNLKDNSEIKVPIYGVPQYSPSGEKISICTNKLVLMNTDFKGQKVLLDETNSGWYPYLFRGGPWSPDGKWIAYIWRISDEVYQLKKINIDDKTEQIIYDSFNGWVPSKIKWINNNYIALYAYGYREAIIIINTTNKTKEVFDVGYEVNLSAIECLSDNVIVYCVAGGLYSLDISNKAISKLDSYTSDDPSSNTVSTNKSKKSVVYLKNVDSNHEIHLYNYDSKSILQLTSSYDYNRNPQWIP